MIYTVLYDLYRLNVTRHKDKIRLLFKYNQKTEKFLRIFENPAEIVHLFHTDHLPGSQFFEGGGGDMPGLALIPGSYGHAYFQSLFRQHKNRIPGNILIQDRIGHFGEKPGLLREVLFQFFYQPAFFLRSEGY